MKYDPKQKGGFPVLPEGEYAGELVDAVDQVSKNGNEMVKLTWLIQRPDGSGTCRVWDYIVSNNSFGIARYSKLAAAIGESESFANGDFDATKHVGVVVNLKVKIKPADGQYDESNQVVDYLPSEFDASEAGSELQTEIPF
jgi:hypothetical protein